MCGVDARYVPPFRKVLFINHEHFQDHDNDILNGSTVHSILELVHEIHSLRKANPASFENNDNPIADNTGILGKCAFRDLYISKFFRSAAFDFMHTFGDQWSLHIIPWLTKKKPMRLVRLPNNEFVAENRLYLNGEALKKLDQM